jgi:hypothetical protein
MRSQFLREQGAGEAGRRGSVANLGITLNPLHAKFKVLSLFGKRADTYDLTNSCTMRIKGCQKGTANIRCLQSISVSAKPNLLAISQTLSNARRIVLLASIK